MAELVQQIRQWEADIITDIKCSNSLLQIRKLVKENEDNMSLKVASMHSLR